MGTAESIQLVDELVKARIPKPTATRLIDCIDRGNLEPDNPKWINLENDVQDLKNDVQDLKSDVQWLKWIVALGFPVLIGIITYLHSDTKTEMQSIRTEMKTEINSVRTEMQSMQKETNAKIDQLSTKIDQILIPRK